MEITKFEDDVQKETSFLKTIESSGFEDIKKEVESELVLMVKAYNEQTNSLVRARIDVEMIDSVLLASPTDEKALENKSKADNSLTQRRKLVRIIRGQILDKIKFIKME